MKLSEARAVVMEMGLHTSHDAFAAQKIDRAIKTACYKFMRESGWLIARASYTVVQGVSEFSRSSVAFDFYPGKLKNAPHYAVSDTSREIVFSLIDQKSFSQIRDNTDTEGRPTIMTFPETETITIYPKSDDTYQIFFEYERTLVDFEPGCEEPSLVELNVPDDFAYDIMAFGAVAVLIGGAPGHPDWAWRDQKFSEAVARASINYEPSVVTILGMNSHTDSYQPEQRI